MKSLASSAPLWARVGACFLGLTLSVSAQQDTVVVFNEIMYHPEGEGGSGEWVELVSLYGVNVDISHWSLDGAVDYTFPEGTVIEGNSYLVVAADPSQIEGAMGPFSGRLDDDGEELRLLNNSGRVMSILDYNDRGEWPSAPDGSGVSLAKRSPLLLASDPSSWHWSDARGGSPGAVNFPDGVEVPDIILNEVAGMSADGFFVELAACPCPDPLGDALFPLGGYEIRCSGGESYVLENQSVVIGGMVSIDATTLGFENLQQGDRLYLMEPGGDRVADSAVLRQRTRARFPDGEEWLIATSDTPGEPNEVTLEDAVVINEIMYHHRPTYDGEGEGLSYAPNQEEWVELYNRGDAAVDLSGWEFDEGIGFAFPDGTMLEPGAYLVVARDAAALSAKYPGVDILGDFRGELNNGRDHLVLSDAWGNPADEVAYVDGGSWPEYADGGGSSLELVNPDSDNSKPGSWAASDESGKSAWMEYSYRGVAERPAGTSFPSRWDELNVGLLDAGEFLIDDVSVIEDPDGENRNMIQNRSFSRSIFGGDGSQDWRFRGNHGSHGKTVVVPDPEDDGNTVLHVVATGATEHMHNQLETTLSGGNSVDLGTEYEISFRAKWLAGSPQLHTRLYFNHLPKKTILAIPEKNGTPGAANSRLVANPGPSFAGLSHSPAVPADREPIVITVDAHDADGIESLSIKWRTNLDDEFDSIPMTVLSNGETYVGTIPGQAAQNLFGAFNETKIQYYIEGQDTAGNTSQWPASGAESRALIPLEDGRVGDTPGHNLRIVMMEPDIEFLHERTNVLSNDRILCTLIDREEHVYYNVGVRLKGSARGRDQAVRVGFSLKMPADNLFHGLHRTVAVDRSGAGNQFSQKEMLVKHAINRAGGIPGMYDDLIYIISPDSRHEGSAMFLKARYDDEYLDGQFENGGDGRMFEYELVYYPTSTNGGAEGLKFPEPNTVVGVPHRNMGDDPENYRWNYLLENNRAADDYVRLMDLLDLFGSSREDDYFERLWDTVDVHQWLRAYAIQVLFGIGDNYANGSQHNMIMYFPPGEKAMYFPWDMDFTFSQAATSIIDNNADLKNMLRDPVAFRSYYAQMDELLQTVFNRDYMETWTEHYSTFLPRENLNNFANYIDQRNRHVSGVLRSRFDTVPFAITSNGGEDFEVAASTVNLEGKGWYNVASVRVGDQEYELTWIDQDVWQLTLPLALGENEISLQALDVLGGVGSIFAPVGNDSITVTNTGSAASANAGNVVVSEIMYHPASPSEAELAEGVANQDAFEFIELHNVSDAPVDLAGARFTRGIDFDFAEGDQIPGGGYVVLVADEVAFALRYPGVAVMGEYSGQLRNSGETIRLRSVDDSIIQEFSYNDREPWPADADGEGNSLVLQLGGEGLPDSALAESWRASAAVNGTPGAGESAPEPGGNFADWLASRGGDPNADPNGDGLTLLAEYALGLDVGGRLPYVEFIDGKPYLLNTSRAGVKVSMETSRDLQEWTTVGVPVESDPFQANGETLSLDRREISEAEMNYARLKFEVID